MKSKNIFVGSVVLGVLVFNLVPAVLAGEPSPLSDELERKLSAFAVQLATPPGVILKATLRPPQTTYGVQLQYEQYQEMLSTLSGQGLSITTVDTGVQEWTMDISCGTAQNYTEQNEQKLIVLGRRVWSHPDGPGGCPHEDGTSHEGTISVAGDWSMSVRKGDETLLAATWSFTCSYSGSESGTSECEEKVEKWEGRYGSIDTGYDSEGPVIVYVISTVVILVAGVYITLRIRRRHQEEGGWPKAQKY